MTADRFGLTVCATMRSWLAWVRWAHLTLALGLLLAAAPPAIGQQPISHIDDALGRLVASVDPITNEAAIYRDDAVGSMRSITQQSVAAVSILDFAAKSGPVGTTVTIYGTGFSSTPSENSVTFSGTPAPVISATSTEIVATVPAGATTGLISVTTALGAATSSEVFTIGPPSESTTTGAGRTSASPTIGIRVPPIAGSGRIAVETSADRTVISSDSFTPPAPYTEGTQGEDGEAEPEDRSRRLDDSDPGPLMTQFIATVAVLAIAVGLQVVRRIYGSGLMSQNCRVIIGVGVFAHALMRRLWSMIDRENDEHAKCKQTKQCAVEADETIMMLKRCFEAQYRGLQPDLRALLTLHGAVPFITNPIPSGICARGTALWWTDDLMVRKEQRIFMMVKEDVFLP